MPPRNRTLGGPAVTNRHRNFRRLAAIALWALLDLGAGAARAVDNLPCSTRRTINACAAECTTENSLLECSCLFDNRLNDSQNATCPPGGLCCWNMPCEKWDGTSAFECLRGGGSLDGLTAKHCGWTPEEGGGTCRCVPPLVRGDYSMEELSTQLNRSLVAPFDCRCPFTTDEQWLRLDVCNPPVVSKLGIKLNSRSRRPTASPSRAASRCPPTSWSPAPRSRSASAAW